MLRLQAERETGFFPRIEKRYCLMLSIRGLSFKYPAANAAALNEVSFDAVRGEVLGLLGPNGAGKTTLIAHLSGLLPIQRGAITLDQQPLAAARAVRRHASPLPRRNTPLSPA